MYTSEDAIRYTYFAALLEVGVKPEKVELERPFPGQAQAELDTVVAGDPPAVLEFKFHRPLPGGKNQPKTQLAGAVFKDFKRLAVAGPRLGARAFFIYVANREMAVYFKNQHPELWALAEGKTWVVDAAYVERRPLTFQKVVGKGWRPLRLTLCLGRGLPMDYALRVYEVADDRAG